MFIIDLPDHQQLAGERTETVLRVGYTTEQTADPAYNSTIDIGLRVCKFMPAFCDNVHELILKFDNLG